MNINTIYYKVQTMNEQGIETDSTYTLEEILVVRDELSKIMIINMIRFNPMHFTTQHTDLDDKYIVNKDGYISDNLKRYKLNIKVSL